MQEIPVWEKYALTVKEAAEISNVGEGTIRAELRKRDCPFVLKIGNKMLVKRSDFEKFINMSSKL
jgi:excisionase family DNA binding protein